MARQINTILAPVPVKMSDSFLPGTAEAAMNILIVEDEELGARKLSKLLNEIKPSVNIVGITESIAATIEWFEHTPGTPDLVLMDIELADGQSFEIFSRMQVPCPVIFTTSYDEHALRAFKLNSIDYLLKPVKKDELQAALTKWKQHRSNATGYQGIPENIGRMIENLVSNQNVHRFRDRFLVKHGNRFVPVFADQIAYIYSSHKLTFIKTKNDQRFMVDYNLEDIGENLDPCIFFKANRQFILASHSIREVHPWFNGKMKVVVHPATEEEVIISRDRAREFRSWLGE